MSGTKTKGYALLVDWDRTQFASHESIVARRGLEPIFASDGAAATSIVRARGAPALVIAELSLPKMDGFSLVRELRALAPDCPVIVVSGFMVMRDAAFKLKRELAISEILAKSAPAQSVERAVCRALEGITSVGPPPAPLRVSAHSEKARLARLREMQLTDDPPDVALQVLVEEVAKSFGVPIALVTLVLEDRQWFKAHFGLSGKLLDERGTERACAFCANVVEAGEFLVVPNATRHPAFIDNPLVKDGSVVGYAGAPLTTPGGETLGSLCIIDRKPLTASADDLELLRLLARRVAGELELRKPHAKLRAAARDGLRKLAQDSVAAAVTDATLQAILGSLETGALVLSEDHRITYANAAVAALTGIPVERIVGMTRDEWVAANARQFDDPTEFLHKMKVLPSGPFAAREQFEIQRPVRRVLRWVSRPIELPVGVGQLSTYTDVTAEFDLASANERLAYSDALTNLPNRRAAEEALGREVARARRSGAKLSFTMLDVDHFKRINDQRGHGIGDEVLRAIGEALRAHVRTEDTIARWGGEEFLLISSNSDGTATQQLANRLRLAVGALHFPFGAVTISGGVAEWQTTEDSQATLARADAALYVAKRAGRNQVALGQVAEHGP